MEKIYGIKATEVVLKVSLGKAYATITFRKTLLSEYATYRTENPIIQAAIERDARFGRTIKLIRSTRTKNDEIISKRRALQRKLEQEQRMGYKLPESEQENDITTDNDAQAPVPDEGESTAEIAVTETTGEAQDNVTYVKDLNQLRQMLIKKCGVPYQALRSEADMIAKGEEYNIKIRK